jgi:hypothetical protein
MLEPPHRFLYCGSMARRGSPRFRDGRTFEQSFRRYLRFGRRRRRNGDQDAEDGGVPVEPNRPNTLNGGAAAELEFDD